MNTTETIKKPLSKIDFKDELFIKVTEDFSNSYEVYFSTIDKPFSQVSSTNFLDNQDLIKINVNTDFFKNLEELNGSVKHFYISCTEIPKDLINYCVYWGINFTVILKGNILGELEAINELKSVSKNIQPSVSKSNNLLIVELVSENTFKYKLNFFLKRTIDVSFSFIALFLLSPLLFIFSVLIKSSSEGPLFYMPIRVGKHGRNFKLYKFRSMYENDNSGILSTVENDPRVTPIGKFIRKYNIDELPQLINVINGDMSLVGPRPHRVYLDKQLQSEIDGYMLRHLVNPGITGWAQCNGWRGPTETHEQKYQRTVHDIYYVYNWNILFDIKILFLTVFGKKVRNNAF